MTSPKDVLPTVTSTSDPQPAEGEAGIARLVGTSTEAILGAPDAKPDEKTNGSHSDSSTSFNIRVCHPSILFDRKRSPPASDVVGRRSTSV